MIDKFVKLCNERQMGAANFDEDVSLRAKKFVYEIYLTKNHVLVFSFSESQ